MKIEFLLLYFNSYYDYAMQQTTQDLLQSDIEGYYWYEEDSTTSSIKIEHATHTLTSNIPIMSKEDLYICNSKHFKHILHMSSLLPHDCYVLMKLRRKLQKRLYSRKLRPRVKQANSFLLQSLEEKHAHDAFILKYKYLIDIHDFKQPSYPELIAIHALLDLASSS